MEDPVTAEDTMQITENQPALKLTKSAVQQVKALLEKEGVAGCGLRVSVSSGGCSGFSYGLDFDKEEKSGDIVLEMDGFKVYVDQLSAPHLKQTVIDYVDALHGGGFKFTNPNATGTCGCGTSFSA